MSLPTKGITLDVIRESMPPYHLRPDLLAATLVALSAPPPERRPPGGGRGPRGGCRRSPR